MFTYKYLDLQLEGMVFLKRGGATFIALKEKAFRNVCHRADNNKAIRISASTKLRKAKKSDTDTLIIQGVSFSTTPATTNNVKYYIPIESDDESEVRFISVEKSRLIPLLFIILLLLSSASILTTLAINGRSSLDIEQGQDIQERHTEVSAQELEYTRFPGYADLHLDKEHPYVYLKNPDTNTVYMKYSIFDESNTLLFESKPIAVGKEIEVDFVSILEPGNHKLTFVQSTYDIETEQECNSATTQVDVMIY